MVEDPLSERQHLPIVCRHRTTCSNTTLLCQHTDSIHHAGIARAISGIKEVKCLSGKIIDAMLIKCGDVSLADRIRQWLIVIW